VVPRGHGTSSRPEGSNPLLLSVGDRDGDDLDGSDFSDAPGSNSERVADDAPALAVQGHRLIQIGVALFLLTSFQGLAVPYFAAPNLGRSVHTLSGFTGAMFLALVGAGALRRSRRSEPGR
jgi:hypothetical protein